MAWLGLFALALLAVPVHADTTSALRLDPSLSAAQRDFAGRLMAYHDPTGRLTQPQVASPPYAQAFKPLTGGLNGGYTTGAWWVRFQVQSTAQELAQPLEGGWWLRLSAPYADYMDVWLPAARDGAGAARDTVLVQRQLGGMRAASQRELPWSLPAVRLPPLPDTEPHWVWVRLSGDRALSLIGGVSSLRELAGVQQQITVGSASVIGMVLLMAFVSLVVGAALPERRFLGYAGYLLTLALLFVNSENLQATLWFPDHPLAAVRMHSFSVCLHTAAALAFARSLLDMPREFPRMARVFALLALAAGVACVLALGGFYGALALPLNVLWLAFAISVIVMCILRVRRNREAWPSLLGYVVYFSAGTLHFAKNLQWLPYTLTTQYSYAIGAVAHILAFFFALGWRVRLRERNALALSRQHGARLERHVNERTRDLREEIARHQRTHEQLAQSLREQRGLLAMVSHEFRTPLGTIGGAAQILTDERLLLDREDVMSEGAKISRTVLRMRDLVDTLLAEEWLDASSEKLSLAPVDLSELLREKVDEHNAGSGQWRISLHLPEARLHILADETLVHIALDNLLTNAFKYAPAGSPVWVRADLQPRLAGGPPNPLALGQARVRVSDEGPGFRPEDLSHIFERFYRAGGIRRVPGIGLGLHMVRRIAELHGGSVTADNAPEGGALLTLTLPLLLPETGGIR